MGFWKFSPFLAIGILVLYQVGTLQAAPFRSAMENPLEPATLTEDEICLLLTAMLNDYVRLKVRELQQEQETEGSSITAQKSPSNKAPCVTNPLEGLLARAERMVKSTFKPTNVGPEALGGRHEELGD
ncbi:calcitonin receptor-stimulating peptide 2-like [Ursus americanus]|uniref:Calcitonin peptide-like domain-containing protein n=1 Tax=Ursus americanus TaxID=9643 RepID=A0A452R8T4_URSAM|nr:calcitonin receptor-stimulating peptide 2-like [Ursus americanus]XP_045652437.1 calcitonin receptor-stimulating peptide 2-like [Ursus americanus]XP_045652439.1 calcitonin receptor-stimulating peptide 2-like [Ursus americanus]XP_045652440.1 calcitonin receptor-stimulating peptide 2-like [Ursus americanus]XP_048069832.1 calcitonin receptor-stimulating peptide 2-like [Ursus arctos]XP_048070671.2 calcitonin receptor-stimulating peptide 2-like [Ursus arctos]XP_057173571.1 calcitonin receptor-st